MRDGTATNPATDPEINTAINTVINIVINDERVVHETVDNEVIIINLENGNYYSLKTTGLYIWQALASEPTEAQLVTWLASRYNAPASEIQRAVTALLAELAEEEIIIRQSSAKKEPTFPDIPASNQDAFDVPVLGKYTNMSDLLLLDPIHDVDEQGWPVQKK
jgi:hypothetical protein